MIQYHALQIAEIILEIVRHVSRTSRSRKADLAALARCCRSFKEQALDLLWSDMDYVEPLLKLVPALSVWYHPLGSRIVRCYKLDRPTTPCDWVRFDYYARRISSLTNPLYGSRDICCAEVFIHLRRDGGAALLPRLRSLVWYQPEKIPFTGKTLLEALSLCPSSLTKLHISGDDGCPDDGGWQDDPLFDALIEMLPDCLPRLQSFKASGGLPACLFDFRGYEVFPGSLDSNLSRCTTSIGKPSHRKPSHYSPPRSDFHLSCSWR
ncbi:hypothetical protein JAAARDRAFT_478429 [Jaapia argillacea MUCL 33604]|uniref:F-box domain-containing protein n=1 Tax=Jaapia argillacea MUCL 33604 TaxID=933084 RepID=A0A067PFB6_9AGAM|nr:hypothetical protein JAAARDRAFT_478429 [Jaapia argillacea MUCL 33604]